MLASLLALLGVALISLSDAPSSSNPAFFFGISLAIASAAFAALLGVHARYLSKLSLPGLDTTQLVLSGYLGMLVLSILLYTLEPSSDSPLDSRDYLLLSSISGLGLVGQITSTIAVSYIPAARVLVIGTLQVFLGFGVQIAMGRNPEGKELVGAGFVLVGVLLGALGKEG